MRRKFELEEELRTALQATGNTVIGCPVAVAYPDPLPSPVPGFTKLDQASAGYWPSILPRDMLPNVAAHKSSPDVALPAFSEWLATTPGPSMSRAPSYPSLELTVTNSMPFHPPSHAASPLCSLVPSEPRSHSPAVANTASREQRRMIMPHPLAYVRHSNVDHPPPPQQPKQESPLLLPQQQLIFGQSAAGRSSLLQPGQSASEASLLPQQMMNEYHQHDPVAVC